MKDRGGPTPKDFMKGSATMHDGASPGLVNKMRASSRESDASPFDRHTGSLDAQFQRDKTTSAATSALQRFYAKQEVLANHKFKEQMKAN